MAGTKVLVSNKRANFEYSFSEHLTAGLVLSGPEVKSLKNGSASLAGAYVSVRDNQAFLVHCHISPYKYAASQGDASKEKTERERKLLLNRSEINRLLGKEKGLVIIPIDIFEARGLIKLNIGIGRPKKKYDKRETIKKRDIAKRIRERVDR